MSQVHAPYHFVPLSKWVYMPDWAHTVSHDVPFKDGYSGVIDYTLTNATPLCVGGDQQQAGQPTLVKWAKTPQGKPVIPGSSLKGMLRSVLEVASFGKFSSIDESHFSFRDVSGKSNYLTNIIQRNIVKPAWLKFNEVSHNWELTTCNQAKVKHSLLKSALGKTIKNADDAVIKYKSLPLSQSVYIATHVKEGKQGHVTWVEQLSNTVNNGEQAHVVFGNNRIKGMGQSKPDDYEFSYCFYDDKAAQKLSSTEINDITNKMFISHGDEQVNYLINNPSTKGIPVFALLEKGTGKLHSLGLAKMPRVLYKHSASDLADIQQSPARTSEHYFDFAELMLGTLREKGLSLKSRVSFSDATIAKDLGIMVSNSVTLNGPKATFKGAYLEQPSPNDYVDYDNKNAKLAGWKRYITQSDFTPNVSENTNVNVKSQLELLRPNSEFNGKIFFNNLKKEELGALLWCIYLGTSDSGKGQYHGLGHGKSLGAGAVQLNINNLSLKPNLFTDKKIPSSDELITHFIEHMNYQYGTGEDDNGWQESVQIKNLLAMTNMAENNNRNLSYMPLTDYKQVKNNKASLPPLTFAGEAIKRTDSKKPEGSLSFAKGRLAILCDDETESSTWFASEKTKQTKLMQSLSFAKAQKAKELAVQAQVKAMERMPEDVKKVTQLKVELEQAANKNAKQEFNKTVELLLTDFMADQVSTEAAQLLYDTARNKKLCEYLNISNKKKLGHRKSSLQALVSQYKLKVSN